jgi:hypothetical protein
MLPFLWWPGFYATNYVEPGERHGISRNNTTVLMIFTRAHGLLLQVR